MKTSKYITITKITLQTINRGEKQFIISKNDKGYFAHELGELTQWAKVFNTDELKAHRLNHNRKYGNRYGRFFRPVAFANMQDAFNAITKQANTSVQYF